MFLERRTDYDILNRIKLSEFLREKSISLVKNLKIYYYLVYAIKASTINKFMVKACILYIY